MIIYGNDHSDFRFLMKEYTKMMKGDSLSDIAQFLKSDLSKRSCLSEDVALKCLVMGYHHRTARLIYYIKKCSPLTPRKRLRWYKLGIRTWFTPIHMCVFRLVSDAASNIQNLIGKGRSQLEAWNSSTVRLFWAARVSSWVCCHCPFLSVLPLSVCSGRPE
jgi:hypothetical protein